MNRTHTRPFLKIVAFTLLSIGASFVHGASAAAQSLPAQEYPELSANAALHYWRVWDTTGMQTEEGRKLNNLAAEQYKSNDGAWAPDEELAKALSGRQDFVKGMIRASGIEGCNWGVAYDEGVGAMLPHVGHLRMAARILGTDARRVLLTGQADEAAARVSAIFGMAAHARTDHIIISSLVSVAIVEKAADEAKVLAESGQLTEAGRARILAMLERFDGGDPFGMKAAIENERRVFLGWIRNNAKGADAGQQVIKRMAEYDDAWKTSPLQGMDERTLGHELDVASGLYLDFINNWDEADGLARLNALIARLEKGEFGELAKLVVPSIGKAYEKNVKGKARVAATIGLLKGTVIAPRAPQPAK